MLLALKVAGCTLGVMYLVAAWVRWIVGKHVPWIRREYLFSIPLCLGLSLNAFSVLWADVALTWWALFGRTLAAGAAYFVFTRPALKLLRVEMGARRGVTGG